MRIDCQLSMLKASFGALCSLFLIGCGGDEPAATNTSAEPSAATQAVEREVESRLEVDGGGHGTGGAAGGGHGSGEMAVSGEREDSYESGSGEMTGAPGAGGHDMNGGGPSYEQQMNSQQDQYQNQQPNRQGRSAVVARPTDVTQWTSEHLLTAVEEKDSAVLQAIQAKAAGSQGDPEFAQLMAQVLQKSSGQQVEAGGPGSGASFGVPGMGSLFGGGAPASGNAAGSVPTMPKIAPGSLPPGGAFYVPQPERIIPSPVFGVDSLEMMIGEAVLAYVPQAVQGSRNAAERLQGAASGHDAGGGGMAPNAGGPPSGHDAPSGAMNATGAGSGPSGHDAPSGAMNATGAGSGPSGHDAAGAGAYGPPAAPIGNMSSPEMERMEYEDGAGMGYISGQRQPSGTLQDEELVRTVVQALITNNSASAWTTLKSVINGEIPTPLPGPLNTEIVLAEVFSAAAPNPAAASELLTTATQTIIADPIENASTLRFLAALAQRPTDHFLMLAKSMPPQAMPPGPNGMNPSGMNAMGAPEQAYAAMMESSMSGEQEYEGGPGRPGGGRLPGPPPSGLPPVKVSETGMAIVANVLWNKATTMAVASQLQAADAPTSVPDALALASTLPSDAIRHAMFTLFEKTHDQGAAGMTSTRLFRDVARDPGVLTVLKALPRIRSKKPVSAGINAPVATADPEESWVSATQDVVLSLRDRLRGVADDPSLAFDGQQPVRLHIGAVPDRSIMIRVPGDLSAELGESAPSATTMYYTACRVTPQRASEMQKIVDHYETRSRGEKREDRSQGILWYDGGKLNDDGTRTSMDVVIQQVGFRPQTQGFNGGGAGYEGGGYDGGGGAPGGPVQYTIEVIVVIARDPKTAPISNEVSSR